MTRRAIPVSIGFIAGLSAAYLLFAAKGMGLFALLAIIIISFVSAGICHFFFKEQGRRALLAIISFVVGVCYLGGLVFMRLRPVMALSGFETDIRGRVYDISGGDSSRLLVYGTVGGIPAGAAVYVNGFLGDIGDSVELSAEILAFNSSFFFDEASYYIPSGIFVKARATGVKEVIDGKGLIFKLRKYSSYVCGSIRRTLYGERGELLAAMVTGDRQTMQDGLKLSLNRAGVGHIASVSGLHVSVAAIALLAAMRKIRLPRGIISAVVILYAFGFSVFAGMRLSAIRAALMISFASLAMAFKRRQDILNTICVVAALICLFSPYSVADASFQLSFAGTFGVAVAAPAVIKEFSIKAPLARAFCTSFAALLCTAPFSLLHFNEISLVAPIVNIAAVPVLSVSIVLGMIYAFTGCKLTLLCKLAGAIEAPVLRICELISRSSAIYIPASGRFFAAAAMICAALVFCVYFVFKSKRKAALFSLFLTSAFVFGGGIYSAYDADIFHAEIINSSNERAVLLRKGGECVIIDFAGNSAESVETLSEKLGAKPSAAIIFENTPAAYSAYTAIPLAPKDIYVDGPATAYLDDITAMIYPTGAKVTLGEQTVIISTVGEAGENVISLLDGATVYQGGSKIIHDGSVLSVFERGGRLIYRQI